MSDPSSRDSEPRVGNRKGFSRRKFLGGSAVGSAALLTGGWASLLSAPPAAGRPVPDSDAPWVGATIPELQAMMDSGELTSRELTLGYLARIQELNPLLHAVIQTNPQAVSIAARRDNERRAGHVRGPLHGIPVIVKDNMAVSDTEQTTAGSLALVRSVVPRDAQLVGQLRDAGAVILGKANLSEWANFRGFGSINGWSARGGFTRCPYLLSNDPLGSSSGSAVSAAASLSSVAVGTETDGSIMAPSNANHTFGLKPTVGLVSQAGIIPIGHSQDTAGPMTRTVTDAAILLGALKEGTGDYRGVLKRGALNGARLGFDPQYFLDPFFGDPASYPVMLMVLDALKSLGATIVDVTTDPSFLLNNDEFNVLLFEFKVQIAEYLSALGHTEMRTLADLIAFDVANCEKEMKYFGQEIFELAEATSGDLTDPVYIAARANSILNARVKGIDGTLNSTSPPLDVLISPTFTFLYSFAAVAGYPSASLPVGFHDDGSPVGFCMVGTGLQEAKILGFMYDLEQELNAQVPPKFLGTVPPEPPDAGLCTGTKAKSRTALARSGLSTRRLF